MILPTPKAPWKFLHLGLEDRDPQGLVVTVYSGLPASCFLGILRRAEDPKGGGWDKGVCQTFLLS